MNVGYGYLLHPLGRVDEKDGQINKIGLDAIRKYMCPLSNGDFRRCLNCQGFKKCQVGQRVAVLLSERDKKTEAAKWQKVMDSMQEKPATVEDAHRKILKDACESGNAWAYIMQITGQSQGAAKETLLGLIRKYPGIAADYGGSRRIMQRPKQITITSMEAEKTEGTVSQEVLEEQERKTEPKPEDPVKKASQAEAALAMYLECLKHEDPAAYYVERRKTTPNAARAFFQRMNAKYGGMQKPHGESKQENLETTEPETVQESVTEVREDDDTVSLEEFLGQFSVEAAEEESDDPEEAEDSGKIQEALKDADDGRERIQEAANEALDILVRIMCSSAVGYTDRISAAKTVLDYAAKMEGWA